MRLKLIFIILFSSVLLLSGCNDQENLGSKDDLLIYTTIYPLEAFAEEIGGELVTVKSVYPPGTDAHTFEPTPKQMTQIIDSDAFIYTGVGIEGFVDAALETLNSEEVKLVQAGANLELSIESEHHEHGEDDDEHGDNHHEGDVDPHVWLDPILSITLAENIKDALVELSPENSSIFEENFSILKTKLEKLDQDFNTLVNEANNHEILVSHAAYGYWEKRYGIEQISVSGLSPTQEPSQKELQSIIETAREHNLQYVIFEQNVTTKVAEIIQKEIGAQSLRLHNLESLTDQDIDNNKDYFSLMQENLEALKKAMN